MKTRSSFSVEKFKIVIDKHNAMRYAIFKQDAVVLAERRMAYVS